MTGLDQLSAIWLFAILISGQQVRRQQEQGSSFSACIRATPSCYGAGRNAVPKPEGRYCVWWSRILVCESRSEKLLEKSPLS